MTPNHKLLKKTILLGKALGERGPGRKRRRTEDMVFKNTELFRAAVIKVVIARVIVNI
jgi:hypothetical protein